MVRKRDERFLNFSDDELIEEIVRRRNVPETSDDVRLCDFCRHFKPWLDAGDPPKNYNPCSQKHEMKFKSPSGYGDEFGFYRTVCPDRAMELENA